MPSIDGKPFGIDPDDSGSGGDPGSGSALIGNDQISAVRLRLRFARALMDGAEYAPARVKVSGLLTDCLAILYGGNPEEYPLDSSPLAQPDIPEAAAPALREEPVPPSVDPLDRYLSLLKPNQEAVMTEPIPVVEMASAIALITIAKELKAIRAGHAEGAWDHVLAARFTIRHDFEPCKAASNICRHCGWYAASECHNV